MITQERLYKKLSYDPETGIFSYLPSKRSRRLRTEVGTLNTNGYIRVSIDSKLYYAHRLAWLYVHGEYPKDQIDHMDGNRANNKISNLRCATPQVNAQNPKYEYSGYSKHGRKWRAKIGIDGKCFYLGSYDTPEEASYAYKCARKQYHIGYIPK